MTFGAEVCYTCNRGAPALDLRPEGRPSTFAPEGGAWPSTLAPWAGLKAQRRAFGPAFDLRPGGRPEGPKAGLRPAPKARSKSGHWRLRERLITCGWFSHYANSCVGAVGRDHLRLRQDTGHIKMKQADIIAITVAALFAIWLIRTGRVRQLAGGTTDPVLKAFEATGQTGAYPISPVTPVTQLGRAIAERARSFAGAPTSQFNPKYPRRACASFVSETLVSLGLMKAEDPRCTGIISKLPGVGARKIGAGPAGTIATQMGDLIFFRDTSGTVRHVEIATGGGMSVGTSSSQLKVGERPIGSRGYPTVDVWRY